MKLQLSFLILSLFFLASSCTISMQNISSHGYSDVEDEQTASPEVKPNLTIPLIKA